MKVRFLLFVLLNIFPVPALTKEDSTMVPETPLATSPDQTQTDPPQNETFPKLVPATTEAEMNEQLPSIWGKAYPRLEELVVLQDQHETLAESSWFGKDQRSNQKKMDELIQEALDILGISHARENTKIIHQLEEQITKTRQTISEYREKQRSAPKDSYVKTTVSQYDEKIKQLEQHISTDLATIQQKKKEIAEQLQKMGIEISQEHVEVLLASIIGDKTVEMSVIFNHVKAINGELSKLMIENKEDTQASRRYYGMYVVLLKILITMQQEFIRSIEQQYIPQIQSKISENQSLMENTQLLLSQTVEVHRRVIYEKNLENQRLISETADLYKMHLTEQVAKVQRVRDDLLKDLTLAMNTYKTVKISGELVEMIRSSSEQFNALANLQIPPLIPFENLQMKLEYENLTTELRRSEKSK